MKSIRLVLVLMIGFSTSAAFAQKPGAQESYGIFQTRDEYHQFMGNVKTAAAGDPEMQSMVGMINDIVLNQPMGSTSKQYGSASNTLGLLADSSIRGDIEMIDGQYRDLQNLNSDIQKRMAERLRGLDFSDSKNVASQIRGIRDEAEKDLDELLLPHQLKRLRQIRAQSQLRHRSLVDLLTSDPLKTDLEITDKQSDELKESEKEIQEELAREIAKLQEKARQKLLSTLNRTQREKVDEIFGEAFEFNKSSNSKNTDKEKR